MWLYRVSQAMEYIDPFYLIITITALVLCFFKYTYVLAISLIVGIYILFFLPITGLMSFKMSWYFFIQGNYQSAILYFCTYMIPIVSAIGLFIWYSDRNKKVNKK